MLPLVTRLAISIGFVVGGSVIIEDIYRYRGLGKFLTMAIVARDYTSAGRFSRRCDLGGGGEYAGRCPVRRA